MYSTIGVLESKLLAAFNSAKTFVAVGIHHLDLFNGGKDLSTGGNWRMVMNWNIKKILKKSFFELKKVWKNVFPKLFFFSFCRCQIKRAKMSLFILATSNLNSFTGFLKLPRFLANRLPDFWEWASHWLKSAVISKIRWMKSNCLVLE